MKIFLPCFQTCVDAMDSTNNEHEVTLLFFSVLAEEKGNAKPRFKSCFSPPHQNRFLSALIDTMNNEWKDKKFEDIVNEVTIIEKVHSALELAGEHIKDDSHTSTAIFELARHLFDENEVYIVTNYPEKINDKKKSWISGLADKDKNVIDGLPVITPSQAIILMKSPD